MNQFSDKLDPYFFQLVLSLQGGAMHQMGKIASPLTGKVERDLDMAKSSIDMLGMIKEKTEGNLTEDEKNLIEHALYELRLNYIDELKKPAETKAERKPDIDTFSDNKKEPDQTESESEPPTESEPDKA
jgi:hypothetical protein